MRGRLWIQGIVQQKSTRLCPVADPMTEKTWLFCLSSQALPSGLSQSAGIMSYLTVFCGDTPAVSPCFLSCSRDIYTWLDLICLTLWLPRSKSEAVFRRQPSSILSACSDVRMRRFVSSSPPQSSDLDLTLSKAQSLVNNKKDLTFDIVCNIHNPPTQSENEFKWSHSLVNGPHTLLLLLIYF